LPLASLFALLASRGIQVGSLLSMVPLAVCFCVLLLLSFL
jgi:hypothetical protein